MGIEQGDILLSIETMSKRRFIKKRKIFDVLSTLFQRLEESPQ